MSNSSIYAKIGILERRRSYLAQKVIDGRGTTSSLEHDREEAEALEAAIEALQRETKRN